MTNSTHQIHFNDPTCHTIESAGKNYYMQNATINGQDILISSEWFRSEGIKAGMDKKPELMFSTAGKFREALNIIESEAVRQLRMPAELTFGNDGQKDNKSLYKPVYNGPYMYAKLHRDCSFFNSRREAIKKTDLGYGEYRVVVAIRGLYIGSHDENGPRASLHMRIFQIQFREVNVTCLFENATGLLSNASCGTLPNSATPPETPSSIPPQPQQPQQQPSSASKKTRKNAKATLPRQNGGVIEAMQHAPTEALPQDFFGDFNL